MRHDEAAIVAVLTRYATGIDERDWTLFRTCFAPDFTGDYPGFGQWNGPEEITEFMRSAHAPLGPTLHRLSNFVVEIHQTSATARCYVDALLMAAEPGPAHQVAGWYDDTLIRLAAGWKIQRRTFIAIRMCRI
jgi:hypothetical protein